MTEPVRHPSDRPVALVTGTSSGMGMHAAVQLAQAGHLVVATMRDLARGDELRRLAAGAEVDLDIRTLDVTDAATVDQVVADVLHDHGRIDVLVNNAGRGSVTTLEELSDAQLQSQLDVNYLGVARMTRAVLPHLREQRSGRVVTVTSVGGVVGQPFADAYCGAKFAVEGLMQSLAPVMASFGVGISVVEPGAVATGFVGSVETASAHGAPETHEGPYAELLGRYMQRMQGSFSMAQTPEDAARTIVEAATTPDWRFRWQTSEWATTFAGFSLSDTTGRQVFDQTSTWIS